MRFPLRKHYVVTPGAAGAGGGGVPTGATNSIQTNNGAGGFSGVGELLSQKLTIGSGNTSGGSGLNLVNGTNDFSSDYLANPGVYSGGANVLNILDGVNVPNSTCIRVEVNVLFVQSSGTPGSSALCFKLTAFFRKDNSGTFTQIGGSIYNLEGNDTGDSFIGTPSLIISAGAVCTSYNLSTIKEFRRANWVKVSAVRI